MIPARNLAWQSDDWRALLRNAVRDVPTLLERLNLVDHPELPPLDETSDFPLLVPDPWLARMQPGNPHDPLLRQVLPIAAERETAPGFVLDPLAERDASAGPGVIRKYRGRALVIVTGGCAVHCRYCFRRHFDYTANTPGTRHIDEVLAPIRFDAQVSEVILSGGDPLLLDDAALEPWLRAIEAIAHVTRLRLHTRLPIVLPQRITAPLIERLQRSRLKPTIVVHANHPDEFGPEAVQACGMLRDASIPLFNQAVLLRGVNDSVATLSRLGEASFDAGAVPYYLHQLDPVSGAAHFEVPDAEARALHAELVASNPGYLVPRLVREVPGAASKITIGQALD